MPGVKRLAGDAAETRRRRTGLRILFCGLVAALLMGPVDRPARASADDVRIALKLAQLLRSARTVISASQNLINNPALGDKGLSGEAMLDKAIGHYRRATGEDPRSTDPNTRLGRLLRAQMRSIVEVMDENQATINRPGIGFKGFVPAVFARLVNDRFKAKVGHIAVIKLTAPPHLVRNRKAMPDGWESRVITSKMNSPKWPKGKVYTAEELSKGRAATRVLVPEYYTKGCLKCHGMPKGALDVSGYPKEGGILNALGGVISITLFKRQ